ncbi:type I-D CRISPR-associated endonuclease Cas1 [Desertifilum sp. FACHB-1129]|uniref:CRISPR-associated endonuclease Cas1 n=1 Tax=Desertifilum tharense IPPAS B-1220 TaxID=1781255 RepID=A0A1E5QGS2_9CYAN|nr:MULTISPECIES: type I-D CRISPR-associated endonuclease Cas1d [Desertifilum]MDA0209600.1 type I-D CRISPR-associated endonuclease Cas1d [Cyanobacteria bacterium FC1]MBD2313010.1 type I-D CRISPR-associated endonuclease Cas1 [Desertifilum sp. FACHB-1129]MBD2320944.1 type I-D CRISPR-associated endonuclease Cas1 [Desertifilum sp. FACHB-866]MBD2331073.1 type I-D CRISPR-associated endonuclease Cas1 [Desertifilum sp. FACHB-868]OEJ73885.1 type I-D CRISPR-associated endonuclease Cas1 [Desertifilum thar
MGTVYITHEDAFIGKTDERITVKANKQLLLDVPLIKVDGVVVLGRATVSPAVVMELLEKRIPLSFLMATGRYLGRLEPEMTKNIFVRAAQWEASGESERAVGAVRGFVRGKLKNYRIALLRRQREAPELDLQRGIQRLEDAIAPIDTTHSINSLRGLEGAGSAAYFGCFPQSIKNALFHFPGRRRRPPTDPVNSLLSFGYALLRHDIQGAINIVGFDPYLGYLHVERYGRPGLALDLMEEFRPLVVDAVVFNAINNQKLTPSDFTAEPISGAVSLTPDGLKIFLRMYEEKKQSKFKHPVMGRQCTYQEAFEIQARLLAKYLMGEIDQYPPLVKK